MDRGTFDESVDDRDVARLPVGGGSVSVNGDDLGLGPGVLDDDAPATHLLPVPPERTLKEKLVERERQKRIETERARLKRQFALSNGGAMEVEENLELAKENGSVVGTVGGGSSVAAAAADMDDEKQSEKLGYAMERFLSESGHVVVNGDDLKPKSQAESGGVVMERFLSEPIVVSSIDVEEQGILDDLMPDLHISEIPSDLPNTSLHEAPASVTFDDANAVQSHPEDLSQAGHPNFEEDENVSLLLTENVHHLTANDSMDANSNGAVEMGTLSDLDRFSDHGINALRGGPTHNGSHGLDVSSSDSSLHSVDPSTRVLRLTEREIQEMEAIEEASIGNAPPSEREDTLSEVGDMVGSFPDLTNRAMDMLGSYSVNTRTTASVSNTSVGGNQSAGVRSQEQEPADASSIDDIATASVSSHLALSPGSSEGGVSVTANPPSVATVDDPVDEAISPTQGSPHPSLQKAVSEDALPHLPVFDHPDIPLDAEASARANAGVVNRRLRPGLAITPPRGLPKRGSPDASEMKRTLSMPEKMHGSVDGFDFDKYDFIPSTPYGSSSYQDLPGDSPWAPDDAKMNVSPLHARTIAPLDQRDALDVENARSAKDVSPVFRSKYGALLGAFPTSIAQGAIQENSDVEYSDQTPLIAPELPHGQRSIAESVFSSIRSESALEVEEEANDAERYKASNILARAFPERFIALLVTLVVEIPVLFMISGGSDRLCSLIGRRRYELMMAFLPLSSAISGNCGLQASTLTTRAISHEQVTVENFREWFTAEVGAATHLALGMGIVLGACGFVMSGYDIAFGVTIFVAQFISLVTAGFTGTMAPLIFTFIFHRDSGKWGGPLETAIQDIVGSFAMVVVSFHILLMLGPHQIASTDVCGGE